MIKININIYEGHVYGCVCDRVASISSLYIYGQYRNQGFGTELLLKFLETAAENNAIHIVLEDCSSNYRQPHNIYLKYGFKYTSDDCAMATNIRNCIATIKNYKDNNNKI